MGEVYRAIDSQLGRNVAIKVLPGERIGDRDAGARFEREGRAIAQLTHPHICTLHDVGSDGDRAYLVMELLSGKTLAERLLVAGTGGLPIVEALGIAIDIARALAFAHRHQIVHRDVKPANIMLTATGAKLVDFGLAHLRHSDPGSVSLATETLVTAPHVVMGTVPYMAPEQLEGRADARTDVFAFGSVVSKCLRAGGRFPVRRRPPSWRRSSGASRNHFAACGPNGPLPSPESSAVASPKIPISGGKALPISPPNCNGRVTTCDRTTSSRSGMGPRQAVRIA